MSPYRDATISYTDRTISERHITLALDPCIGTLYLSPGCVDAQRNVLTIERHKRKMRAYSFNKYGKPEEVLVLQEVEKPVPKENEVLVKVRTTTINDFDWCLTRGKPYAYRLFFGIFKPRKKLHIPGMEVAGTVEKVGSKADKFEPGDAVYGDTSEYSFGSFAQYMCLNEKALNHKPAKMSFEEAASIPHAAMLAFQGLYDVGQIKREQKVLINGAGGGVGAFGLQFAKLHKAEVTGVDTGAKLKMMQQQGFDHVIDYKREDFTKNSQHYDLILDCKTNRWPSAYLHVLNPNGKYITVGGQTSKLLLLLFFKPLVSLFSNKKLHIVALKANKDIDYVNRLYESDQIKCIIDGPYPFEKVPWAIRYFGEGKHHGKVVISVS